MNDRLSQSAGSSSWGSSSSSGGHHPAEFAGLRIVEILGRGGMGVVYKALDPHGRVVALKVLSSELAEDKKFVDRFQREASAASVVRHPSVTSIHHVGSERGVPYLVFEFVPGGSLAQRLKASGPLHWRDVAAIGADIAHALAAVHAAGFVHRDLKPENVLLDEAGRPKLADFGIVRAAGAAKLTRTGELLGTPEYMAPEQVDSGRASVDFRADLYGLGATMFALLAGTPPFAGKGYAVISKKMTEDAPRLETVAPGTSPRLADLVAQLLAREPQARGESTAAVAELLDSIAEGGAGARARAWPKRVALALAFFALAAVSALGASRVNAWRAGIANVGSRAVAAEPLELAFDEVPTGSIKEGATVRIRGRLEGSLANVVLTVGGSRVALEAGRFRAELRASPDVHHVEVVATRPDGARVSSSVAVSVVPVWYERLAPRTRPALPLPAGVRFSATENEYVNDRDGSVLLYVPEAAYYMGISEEGRGFKDAPLVRVFISSFFVGKYEVTNEQFARFVEATRHVTTAERLGTGTVHGPQFRTEERTGATWRSPTGEANDADPEHPVVQVSHEDALAYVQWAGLDLPTEAEWEKVACWDPKDASTEVPQKRHYPFGELSRAGTPAVVADQAFAKRWGVRGRLFPGTRNTFARTAPARSFPEGASLVGAHHLTGNVSEWCLDAYDANQYESYKRDEVKDPFRAPASATEPRVHRGGGFGADGMTGHVSHRGFARPDHRTDALGFRVVARITSR